MHSRFIIEVGRIIAAARTAAGTGTAAATTVVIGTGRDAVITAVAGGPMASAVAGGRLLSVMYGYVVESARADGGKSDYGT